MTSPDGMTAFDALLWHAGRHPDGAGSCVSCSRRSARLPTWTCLLDWQQVPLACPAIDHVAVAPPSGQWAHPWDLTGWEADWEGPGRLGDHLVVVVTVDLQSQPPAAASSRP